MRIGLHTVFTLCFVSFFPLFLVSWVWFFLSGKMEDEREGRGRRHRMEAFIFFIFIYPILSFWHCPVLFLLLFSCTLGVLKGGNGPVGRCAEVDLSIISSHLLYSTYHTYHLLPSPL